MEACPGSQWLARKLEEMGHDVRIIPAQFIKPYVKSHKNDVIDAEAIAEAATRPTMRFVGIFKLDIARALEDTENDLTERARIVLQELQADLLRLEERIRSVSTETKNIADMDETARRLMTIPGVGSLGATAILASIGDPSLFKTARDVG